MDLTMGDQENDGVSNNNNKDQLSRFLERFPSKACFEETTDSILERRVFWSQNKPSSYDDDVLMAIIHDKIKTAFCDVNSYRLNDIIIQFWAPDKTMLLLSTLDQPFALVHLNSRHRKYRLGCMSYQYSIDNDTYHHDNNNKKIAEVNTNGPTTSASLKIISNGLVATAFQNGLPEVVLDLRRMVHKRSSDSPLLNLALECGLNASLFLPVFTHQYDSSSSCRCVGVVECSVRRFKDLLVIFNQLKLALERVGLTIYHHKDSLPYKTTSSFKRAADEIEDALEIVGEAHDLTLGQVWIPYESQNHHVSSASCLEDILSKQRFLFKLIDYYADSDTAPFPFLKDFCENCDMLPLKFGEGLVGKALQTYQPHFCRNLSKLSDNVLSAVLSANTKCSCLVICLRSIHTGDVDYVFEFLWTMSQDYLLVLESLVLTLEACLPSFKLPSGAEIGGGFNVIDVENSTAIEVGSFKIVKGNRLPITLKALEEGRRSVAVKRKFSDLFETQIDPSQEDNTPNLLANINKEAYLDDDDDQEHVDLVIVAYYKEDMALFLLPSSSTLANATEKINEDFSLDQGTYTLKYEFYEGIWLKLENDGHFTACKEVWGQYQKSHIKLLVEKYV